MVSRNSEDFKKSLDEYQIVYDKIISILNDAKIAILNKTYNEDIEKNVYSKIEGVGPLASSVIGNIIAYYDYQEFFRRSFVLLKPYIEDGLKEKWGGNKDGMIELLYKVGEQGYDLLCYVFLEDTDESRRFKAARGLVKLDDNGINFLRNALTDDDAKTQTIAIGAIARIVTSYFSDRDFERENSSLSQKDIDNLIDVLRNNLFHRNDNVRINCLSALLEIKKLDVEIIESAIEDKNPNVRYATLKGLLDHGIGKRESRAFVTSLEDPIKKISDFSFERLDGSFIKNPDAVLSSIIDELIIRTSGRPKEFFNTKLPAEAVQKITELNPRLMGQTLHKLRDIAFEYHDQPIMPRSVFVAQELNQKEFVALIGEKAKEAPDVAQKILKVIDSGLSITSLSNLGVSEFYIDPNRIVDLKSLSSIKFDLIKLIRFCEELNSCYQNGNSLSVIMLVRAILDHTPPIFGYKIFVEVANNYGGKSLKKSLLNLQNSSRNIADAHLHEAIRSKETLPNKTQVDFRNDLDVLLSEIVRLLK